MLNEQKAIRLSASILAADFARLGAQVAEAEAAGVDAIHFDVMDGIFVPNISIGLPILEAVRRSTRLPIDVHLMIARPDDYLAEIVQAGANWVTVHVEGAHHLHRTLTHIRDLGAHPGVTLNPGTPPGALAEVLPMVDLVLVMTVNPGFGGQRFIEGQLPKIAALRAALDAIGSDAILSVDGGVGAANATRIVAAGATQLVAGSAIFHEEQSVAEAVRALRAAQGEGESGRTGEGANGR